MKNFKHGQRFKVIAGDFEGMTGIPWRVRRCDSFWWVKIDDLDKRPDLHHYAPFIGQDGDERQHTVLLPPWLCEPEGKGAKNPSCDKVSETNRSLKTNHPL